MLRRKRAGGTWDAVPDLKSYLQKLTSVFLLIARSTHSFVFQIERGAFKPGASRLVFKSQPQLLLLLLPPPTIFRPLSGLQYVVS